MGGGYTIAVDRADGRVVVMDSVSRCDAGLRPTDVVVAGSFCGAASVGTQTLPYGPRAVIAHACGVGRDEAGISVIRLCDRHGIPAAAIETMSARISDAESAWQGRIGHVNEAAAALGVRIGQPVADAALLLLRAPPGRPVTPDEGIDNRLHELHRGPAGAIFAIWNPILMAEQRPHPRDVFCIATHSGKVMAERALGIRPGAVIANDGGLGLDDSGVSGLATLQDAGVAAAAVAAMSARIGDALSTYHDGLVSTVNAHAAAAGVTAGMPARTAARRLLDALSR